MLRQTKIYVVISQKYMKKLKIAILLILTIIQNVYSQDKVIIGDTVYWYNQNQKLNKTLELIDFSTSRDDFSFRFRNHGQIVEIFKTKNQIHGVLTNYIFHSIKKRSETLHQEIQLDSVKALEIYDIIQKSGIIDLQSDNKIDGWSGGCDGITYIIEHSDKKEYWFKTYWTPSAQDSIPESLIVMDFVKALSDTLQLSEKYKEFKEELPHRGCYNSGGMVNTCYISNSFGFGYNGSTKLPFGFNTSVYLTYIGKNQTNLGLGFQYKFDSNGNYDVDFYASKSNLFINNSKTNDFLGYNYQKRKLDFVNSNIVFQNHRFIYGISIKNILNISSGIDYLVDDKDNIGGIFSVSKWFSKPSINTTMTSSIFKNEIDYKIGISKSIQLNNRFVIRSASVGLYFENFKKYNDLNINLTFWL